jgi:hypothetical protein
MHFYVEPLNSVSFSIFNLVQDKKYSSVPCQLFSFRREGRGEGMGWGGLVWEGFVKNLNLFAGTLKTASCHSGAMDVLLVLFGLIQEYVHRAGQQGHHQYNNNSCIMN